MKVYERAKQYPILWHLAKVLTVAREMTADEIVLMQCLEEMAQALPSKMVRVSQKKRCHLRKKPPSRLRTKKIRTRIKVGLTYWIGEYLGQSIRAVCQEYRLVALNTYYTYQQEGLAYEEADLIRLGATWSELWAALQQHENTLEACLDTLLLVRKWRP